MYDRFIIVSCKNVIPEEQRDAQLLEKLEAESEYTICVAIKFLRKSIERGYTFTESERTIKNREEYAMRNNSLALFLNDCCEIGVGSTTTRVFRETYQGWCKDNHLPAEKQNSIGRILVEDFGIEKFKSNTEMYRLTIKNI